MTQEFEYSLQKCREEKGKTYGRKAADHNRRIDWYQQGHGPYVGEPWTEEYDEQPIDYYLCLEHAIQNSWEKHGLTVVLTAHPTLVHTYYTVQSVQAAILSPQTTQDLTAIFSCFTGHYQEIQSQLAQLGWEKKFAFNEWCCHRPYSRDNIL